MSVTELNSAELFFFRNAGYSYDPKTETQTEGRIRMARDLAAAAKRVREEGYEYNWSIDDIDSSDFDDEHEPHKLWQCFMIDPKGNVVESLGGIDLGADGEPDIEEYAMVVAAELASEHFGHEAQRERDRAKPKGSAEYHNRTDFRAFDVIVEAINNASIEELRDALKTAREISRDHSWPGSKRAIWEDLATLLRKQIRRF